MEWRAKKFSSYSYLITQQKIDKIIICFLFEGNMGEGNQFFGLKFSKMCV